MKAVRHLPVAEQYPSNTATVSVFASNRISSIAFVFPEEVGKRLNALHARIRRYALGDVANGRVSHATLSSDFTVTALALVEFGQHI